MHPMMRVVVRREAQLTASMEHLRASVLGHPSGSTRDSADARSSHVVAYVDGRPIGMVRETLARPSLLAYWARGSWMLPADPNVMELTRGVVAEDWRHHGVYRLLMLEAMSNLSPATLTFATAAIEPDFVGRRFLDHIGFRAMGHAQSINDDPRIGTIVVPILTPVDRLRRALWTTMLSEHRRRLLERGIMALGSASCDFSHSDQLGAARMPRPISPGRSH